ncbi:MAG: class I SAM-dependent methyltransferase [Acidobacteriota bacterium]
MDERAKWESRYKAADEPFYGHAPSAFLAQSLELLPRPGRCLDLGGGEGRNALYLASLGWEVTVADVAVAGLARARALCRSAAPKISLVAADLTATPLRPRLNSVDLILVINFHHRNTIRLAAEWLRPGGALLVEGFALEQLGRPSGGPRDPRHLWEPNELLSLAEGLRVKWYEDREVAGDDNPRHRGARWVVRMIASREAGISLSA